MLKTREAFFLASTPFQVGATLLGRALLARVDAPPAPGPVADQLAFYQQEYDVLIPKTAALIGELEATLARQQLAVPPRPQGAPDFVRWRDAIVSSFLATLPPATPASLAAMVGLSLGEVVFCESLLATALALLAVVPEAADLAEQARGFAKRMQQSAAQLAQLVALPLAPPAIRRIGHQMVSALQATPDLLPDGVDAARAAAVREHHSQLEALHQALGQALSEEVEKVLLVPPFLLGYLPTATGVPFQCMDLFAQLEAQAPPAVTARIRELIAHLKEGNRETVENVLAVESILRHHQLAVPPRPQTPADFFAWLSGIRQAAPRTVEPQSAAGGVFALGFYLADLLVTLRVGIATLRLLDAAPDFARAQAQLAASAKGLQGARHNLDQALRHPATPEPARTIGRRLADRVAQAPTFDAVLPIADRIQALEAAALELAKGKDEIAAALVKVQQS